MLGALLIMALGIVLARRWGHPEGTTMLDVTAWQLVIGGVFLVPLAALTEGKPPSLTTSNTVGFLYLGLFGTALAYVLWFRGIERLGAGPVSFLSLVNPAVATIGGILVLQQNLTILQALGLFLALGAMFVGQAAPKTTTIAEPPVPVDPVPGWAVPADPVPGKGGSPIPAIGREFRE